MVILGFFSPIICNEEVPLTLSLVFAKIISFNLQDQEIRNVSRFSLTHFVLWQSVFGLNSSIDNGKIVLFKFEKDIYSQNPSFKIAGQQPPT